MLDKLMLDKISPRIWAIAIMCAWGAAILWLGLVSFTPYGLDEGAAMALLLNWSVADSGHQPRHHLRRARLPRLVVYSTGLVLVGQHILRQSV